MSNLIPNHTGPAFTCINIQNALNTIKTGIENAILSSGSNTNYIRTSIPIKLIHDVVKTLFYQAGVHPSLINPNLYSLVRANNNTLPSGPINLIDSELKLAGYLKCKNQDVSIIPNNVAPSATTLNFPTYLNNHNDRYGNALTESTIAINIRSQLNSIAKNFDTLYERTFAEPLNLHLRFPQMVLGEVYMIATNEYDSNAASRNQIAFRPANHVEKYILAFQALNNRSDALTDHYKYERVALIVVDFSKTIPKIYDTTADLISDGIIPSTSQATIEPLSLSNFVADLMAIYRTRFPANTFR